MKRGAFLLFLAPVACFATVIDFSGRDAYEQSFDITILETLRAVPKTTTLLLANCSIDDFTISSVAEAIESARPVFLEKIVLSNNVITDVGALDFFNILLPLTWLPALKSVNLNRNYIGKRGEKALAELSPVAQGRVSWTQVTNCCEKPQILNCLLQMKLNADGIMQHT